MVAKFKSRYTKLSVIQCYAPTNNAEEETKDTFYQQLLKALDNVTSHDVVLVIGDLNTNEGREKTMGKNGCGEMNKIRERLAEICGLNDLVIGNYQQSTHWLIEKWCVALIIKLPKNRDRTPSTNWRGVTLLSVLSKIFCKIILCLQKRAFRLMFFGDYRAHAVPFFISSSLLPLDLLYFKSVAVLMYDVSNNTSPPQISNLFDYQHNIHSHNTRS